jgi:maleate isomerase
MRPPGVTNHIARILIPNNPLRSDRDFERLISSIAGAQMAAIEAIMTCEPDRLVLGISAETFWDGLEASARLEEDLERITGLQISTGARASALALERYNVRRLGVITPYWPVGDANVTRFFKEAGFEVVSLKGLRCESPVKIAHVSEDALRSAIEEVDGDAVEAVVQVGTNLSMAHLAAEAERSLGKPVIAINTAIYWHALRASGIVDRFRGFGSLLAEH